LEYFVFTIEECEKTFGVDKTLSRPKQISLLAKQKLLSILKEKGLSFDTTIAVKEKGKPYFINFPHLHFSISHSSTHIALALDDKEIGIDIENLRTCNLNLAKRYFHQEEYEYLLSIEEDKRNEAFTKIWTQKEAFVKCTGEGIANNFKTFSVIEKSKFFDSKYTLYYNKEHNLSICTIE
jgi:phosphopantetheine--protein transferase-like protein